MPNGKYTPLPNSHLNLMAVGWAFSQSIEAINDGNIILELVWTTSDTFMIGLHDFLTFSNRCPELVRESFGRLIE